MLKLYVKSKCSNYNLLPPITPTPGVGFTFCMCNCTFVPHTKGAGFCGCCHWNDFFTCSGVFVFLKKGNKWPKSNPDSHFYSFWFSHCNLLLSLQRCVRSWIRSLAACNPLFQCTPQNQNYMLGLQARLDTICRHEYLIWCRRGCSKHSLSSFIMLWETNAWKQSWLCGFYLGRLCAVTVFGESQQSWYISFPANFILT